MVNEKRLITEAYYKKPWYGSYKSMMDRCYREKSAHYDAYGGRGISVCEKWHNIEYFGSWAETSGFQKGLTLERIDVNGNYCPDNCTWATPKQQKMKWRQRKNESFKLV